MVFHQKSNVVMYKTGYTGSSGAWIEAVVMLQLLGSQIPVTLSTENTPQAWSS